jgi:hypothetical protein
VLINVASHRDDVEKRERERETEGERERERCDLRSLFALLSEKKVC